MAIATAGGKLAIPVVIQVILDRGLLGDQGFRPGFVAATCGVTAVVVVVLFLISRATYLRLIRAAENALFGLRTRTFAHIHRLSIAEHTENRRGELVARVTSDIETLAQFTQWGAVSWIVNSALIVGTIGVMLLYSWQLTLLVVVVFLPLIPILRYLQIRQLAAYDLVRTTVGTTMSEVSEAVTGAAVVRGLRRPSPRPGPPGRIDRRAVPLLPEGRSVLRRDVPTRRSVRFDRPGGCRGRRGHVRTRVGSRQPAS